MNVSPHIPPISPHFLIFLFSSHLSSYVCSTGSSLMPQKKNADSLELIRSKAGRVFGRVRPWTKEWIWLNHLFICSLNASLPVEAIQFSLLLVKRWLSEIFLLQTFHSMCHLPETGKPAPSCAVKLSPVSLLSLPNQTWKKLEKVGRLKGW